MVAGDDVDVVARLDDAPRDVEAPAELADALSTERDARSFFEALAPSHRMEWVRWVEEAKKDDTRMARIARAVESLREGKRTR